LFRNTPYLIEEHGIYGFT